MPQSAQPAATPLPATVAPQLIPDEVLPAASPAPSAPNLQQLDEAFKDTPLTKTMADSQMRIEWRKLRNVIANDHAVHDALAFADAAKTDLEKRKRMRRYYEILYGKMTALASTPEMKTYLAQRKGELLNTLPQPHVRPEPSPSPGASIAPLTMPSASPTATPARKSKELFPAIPP